MMDFLVDGMLGRVARWLRLMGHSAVYINDLKDNDLLETAYREGRMILTRDLALYRKACSRGIQATLVKGPTHAESLAWLSNKLGLKLEAEAVGSRCPKCGSLIRKVPRETLRTNLHSTTLIRYQEFWQCLNPACRKIYWKGSHWTKIEKTLAEARKALQTYQRGD